MKKFVVFITIATINIYNSNVYAASAVAYGITSAHSVTSLNSREEAVQKVLETCSKGDSNCKIATKCEKKGFGAVAYEKKDKILTSVGAACGVNSFDNAEDKALTKCKIHAKFDDCKIKSKWID